MRACARVDDHQMVKRSALSFVNVVVLCIISIVSQVLPSRAATCPVTIQSAVLQAKGASGRALMYRVITDAAPDVTSVELVINAKRGQSTVVIADVDRTDKTDPLKAVLWFERPSNDAVTAVSSGSVVADGDTVPCADPSIALTDFDGPTTIYDDSTHDADLDEARGNGVVQVTDSDFVSKVQPDYPDIAKEQDVTGDVTVEITVGPKGGHPLDAWVNWNFTSNGSDILVRAALNAARAATFSPPLVDGRPTTRNYLIEYTFELGPPFQQDKATALDMCPLVVTDVHVTARSGSDPNAWYFLSASGKKENVASAVVGVEDRDGTRTGYLWSGPIYSAEPTDPPQWTADATFNLPSQDIKSMWIDHVTLIDGKQVPCIPVVARPTPTAGLATPPRVMSGKPLPLIAVESVLKPIFTKQIWPEYPADAGGKREAGHVTVLCIVGDTGYPIDAFVTESSSVNGLDVAALDAAAASTFAPAGTGGIKIYEVTYRFAP